jgi:hypothetical protein
LKRGRKIGKIK